MRRIIVITVLVFTFFIIEFLFFNIVGWWFNPQMLLLLIMFFNLYLGVRYGLYSAILAGILKDSFSASVFGFNIVTFIIDAYMTTFLRKYIYYRGSRLSRLILVFSVCCVDFCSRLVLNAILGSFDWWEAVRFAFVPTLITTLLLTTTSFRELRQCVSRLFV